MNTEKEYGLIENEEYYQLNKRCDLDITPNSHDCPSKKAMLQVRRMCDSIVGRRG